MCVWLQLSAPVKLFGSCTLHSFYRVITTQTTLIISHTQIHNVAFSLSVTLGYTRNISLTHTLSEKYNSVYSCLPGDKILLLLSPFSWTNLLCFPLTFMSAKRSVYSHCSLTMWHVTSLLAGHLMSQHRLSASEQRLTDWLLCRSVNFAEERWKAISRQVREGWFSRLTEKVTQCTGRYVMPYNFMLWWPSPGAVQHGK